MASKSDSDSDTGLKQAVERMDKPVESEATSQERLPHELVVDILSRLTANDLWPFRCVCKSWFRLIARDPDFAKSIFDRSLQLKPNLSVVLWGDKQSNEKRDKEPSKQEDDFYLVTDLTECDKPIKLDLPFLSDQGFCPVSGICNGMLCLSLVEKHQVYIWNPLTNDHITIPYPPTAPRSSSAENSAENRLVTVFGIGFLPSANQYKVIKLVSELNWGELKYRTQLSVYTLGTGSDSSSWETLYKDLPYGIAFPHMPCPHINGVVHWLARKEGRLPLSTIVAFDLKNQSLYEIDPPINLMAYGFRSDLLCVQDLGGSLCLFNATNKMDVNIWTMKLDGQRYSWNKHFTVGTSLEPGDFCLLIPLGVVAHSRDIILIKINKGLITYNSKTNTINHLKEIGFPIRSAHAYIGSIISPRVISGVGRIMT